MDASSGFDLFSSFLHSDLMCSELFAKPFAAGSAAASSAPASAPSAASSLVPAAPAAASASAPSAPSVLSSLDPLAFARQAPQTQTQTTAQPAISLNEADLGAVTALARAALPSPQFFGQAMTPNESLSLFADSHAPAYLGSGLATGLGLYPADLSSLPISSLFPGSTDATAGLLGLSSLLNSSRPRPDDISVGATVGRSAFTPKAAGSLPSFPAPAPSPSSAASSSAPAPAPSPSKGSTPTARGTKRKAAAAASAVSSSPTASTARSLVSTPRSSSPDGTVHSAADTEDEKTMRRRLRERESARRCRQRKQNLIADLEAQVKQLKADNDSLRQMQERSRIEYLVQERERLLLTVETLLTSARFSPATVEPQLASPLAALEKNSNAMRDLLKRDMEVLPLFLEMSQLRNIILWMLLAPMEASRLQQLSPQTQPPSGPAASTAAAAASSTTSSAAGGTAEDTESIVMTVERINQQLQKEIGFSPQQVEAIGEFRTKWQDAIRRAFEGNRVVIDLLGAFEKNKRAIATYHTVLSRVREDVFAILSPTQQARMQVWLFKHKNLLKCLLSAPRFPNTENCWGPAPTLQPAVPPTGGSAIPAPSLSL